MKQRDVGPDRVSIVEPLLGVELKSKKQKRQHYRQSYEKNNQHSNISCGSHFGFPIRKGAVHGG
jgi:hypothetical protein